MGKVLRAVSRRINPGLRLTSGLSLFVGAGLGQPWRARGYPGTSLRTQRRVTVSSIGRANPCALSATVGSPFQEQRRRTLSLCRGLRAGKGVLWILGGNPAGLFLPLFPRDQPAAALEEGVFTGS
jgi:hypothetical protein